MTIERLSQDSKTTASPAESPPRRLDEICQTGMLATWRMRSETPDVERTRVDWPLLLRAGFSPPVARAPHASSSAATTNLNALLHAFQELGHYRDLDALLRRSVECLRHIVGLERAAVLLLAGGGDSLRGSWGTDQTGATVDERHIEFDLGNAHRDAFARAKAGLGHWLVLDDVPLLAQRNRQTVVVGQGWNAMLPVLGTSGAPLGLVVCDAALSHRPADESVLCAAAVFSALLGGQIERFGHELAVAAGQSPELSARAIRLMRDNPDLPREELARRLGVSVGLLGKRFKAEMSENLSDYRNRIRVERFLKLVDPGGGNLLGAALDAGFGSYAQFHRVFRGITGSSPKEYVAAQAKKR